jgi:hypothetical protein
MKYFKMSQKISIAVVISLFFTVSAFAEFDVYELDIMIPAFETVSYYASTVPSEEGVTRIRNNEFFMESLRLARLARETFEFGDFEASAGFAQEAILFAQLSDEFVAGQLIIEAKRILDWADANNIAARHPNDYNESRKYYEISITAQTNEVWGQAIESAINTIEILTSLQVNDPATLPRQYTVRSWASARDCLWNIAGYSFVYGDPFRWRDLYEANRSRLPDPNNPDLIEPGMVLDIPSIRGEARQGMWNPNRP